MGSGLKTIGSYAFRDCSALTQIVLPDGFEKLGDWAFSKCTGLKSIYLGKSITDIGSAAFRDCTGLTDVFLPKSLLGISPMSYDTSPFAGCTGSLNLYSDAPKYNQTWDRYFGRITYGVSYEEYLSIVGDR